MPPGTWFAKAIGPSPIATSSSKLLHNSRRWAQTSTRWARRSNASSTTTSAAKTMTSVDAEVDHEASAWDGSCETGRAWWVESLRRSVFCYSKWFSSPVLAYLLDHCPAVVRSGLPLVSAEIAHCAHPLGRARKTRATQTLSCSWKQKLGSQRTGRVALKGPPTSLSNTSSSVLYLLGRSAVCRGPLFRPISSRSWNPCSFSSQGHCGKASSMGCLESDLPQTMLISHTLGHHPWDDSNIHSCGTWTH